MTPDKAAERMRLRAQEVRPAPAVSDTLREIARKAPYMHDGRFKTLEELVEFYNRGGTKNPHQDNTIIPPELTEQGKQDLVALLRSLNGKGWQQVAAPRPFSK